MIEYVEPDKELEPFVVLGSEIVYKQSAQWFEAHWQQLSFSFMRSRRHFAYDMDKGKLPLIVFIPGGGFSHTDRNALLPEMVWYAKHGFAVASVGYSITAKTRFPMQIEDIKQAIRYIRAHAEELGVDEDRIGIMGESSGGYLAAFTALSNADKKYETGEYLEYSSEVKAAVVMYPVVTPSTMYELIGKPIPMPDALSYPDLTKMVGKESVPFLIICGEKDDKCPFSESENLYKALNEAGADAKFCILRNTDHADLPLFAESQKQSVALFFKEKLG